jgi:hypothetical protein
MPEFRIQSEIFRVQGEEAAMHDLVSQTAMGINAVCAYRCMKQFSGRKGRDQLFKSVNVRPFVIEQSSM